MDKVPCTLSIKLSLPFTFPFIYTMNDPSTLLTSSPGPFTVCNKMGGVH